MIICLQTLPKSKDKLLSGKKLWRWEKVQNKEMTQTEHTKVPQTETDEKIQFIGITQYKI